MLLYIITLVYLLAQFASISTAPPAAAAAAAASNASAHKFDKTEKLRKKGINVETEYETEIQDIIQGQEERRKRRSSMMGLVTSTKNSKTVTVTVFRRSYVRKFDRYFQYRKKFMVGAHNIAMMLYLIKYMRVFVWL
jgi:ADP-dependent phosphofructokinase/glucokinase